MRSPNEVFASLSVSAKFKEGLWEAQKAALEQYAKVDAGQRVVAIELPTGAGKGVLGLLIAEAHRDDGKSVAYLCDTDALGERILQEARDLGVNASFIRGARKTPPGEQHLREADLDAYQWFEKVGIFSYKGFLAGRGVPPADVVIVDDAHAFEDEVLQSSSLTLERRDFDELYLEIVSTLRKEPGLDHLEVFTLGGFVGQDYVNLIPFNIVQKHARWLGEKLHAAARTREGDDLNWQLPTVAGRLSDYLVLISRDSIAFRPYVASAWDLKVGFQGTKSLDETVERLVLMSATLGTEDTIKERFGLTGKVISIDASSVPEQKETMGERLIIPLAATSVDSRLTNEGAALVATILKDFHKALVLCNSGLDAKLVRGALMTSKIDPDPVEYRRYEQVEAFKTKTVGALIATNRSIGLDLGSRWCSVGIQVRIPYIVDPLDALRQSIPRDTAYTNEKVAQRLTQAFGRLNRGNQDRSVYFILDERFFGEVMRDDDFFRHFPPSIRAQIYAGWREGAGQGQPYALKKGLAEVFLAGNLKDYDKTIAKYRSKTAKMLPPKPSDKTAYIDDMVSGWRHFARGRPADAAPVFEAIATRLREKEPEMAAWHFYLAAHMYSAAAYKQGARLDAKKVVGLLQNAYSISQGTWTTPIPGIINGLTGAPVPEGPLSPESLEVKRRVAENWRNLKKRARAEDEGEPTLTGYVEKLVLTFRTGTHGQVCHELAEILRLAGYDNIVRERAEGENLDVAVCSAIETPHYAAVFEVKTREKDKTQVVSGDIDQVVADAKAQVTEGGLFRESYPVIVSNRDEIHGDALKNAEKTGTRIIRSPAMERFVRLYFGKVEQFWGFDHAGQAAGLIPHLPSPQTLRGLFGYRGKVEITEDEVNAFFGGKQR